MYKWILALFSCWLALSFPVHASFLEDEEQEEAALPSPTVAVVGNLNLCACKQTEVGFYRIPCASKGFDFYLQLNWKKVGQWPQLALWSLSASVFNEPGANVKQIHANGLDYKDIPVSFSPDGPATNKELIPFAYVARAGKDPSVIKFSFPRLTSTDAPYKQENQALWVPL